MPAVLRYLSIPFFLLCGDRDEPLHIHIEREDKVAKFWLDPIRLQNSGGFNRAELNRIQKIIQDHHQELMEAWNDYFGY